MITSERENLESKFSALRTFWVVLSLVHNFDQLALKSPITTVTNGLFWVTDSIVRFNLFKKLSDSSADWLGDL